MNICFLSKEIIKCIFGIYRLIITKKSNIYARVLTEATFTVKSGCSDATCALPHYLFCLV